MNQSKLRLLVLALTMTITTSTFSAVIEVNGIYMKYFPSLRLHMSPILWILKIDTKEILLYQKL